MKHILLLKCLTTKGDCISEAWPLLSAGEGTEGEAKLKTPARRPGFRQATIELYCIFGAAASTSSETPAAYFSKFLTNNPPRLFAFSS